MKKISFVEFVALMAVFVSLMAMSIDTILPALSAIKQDLGVESENKVQFVIGILFLGFTFGQIIFGPISDSLGRKKTIYLGLAIFIIGNYLSFISTNFEMMLCGRFLQGFGASAPRVISIAVVRDLYKGREMARVMSFVMTIFIIVPVIAPSIGQAIMLVASWRIIFIIFLIASILTIIWTFLRLPETLKSQDLKAFDFATIKEDFLKVVRNKITLGYAICAGLIFSALIAYLCSASQIFQEYFQIGSLFPIYFAISALSIGASSITNSLIVRRYGMRLICHYSLLTLIIVSALFFSLLIFQSQQASLQEFMIYCIIAFFCLGLLFGNLNSLAMEPMGHFAGMASAIIGTISSAISLAIGTLIGQAYNHSLIPLITGFLILSSAAFILQYRLAKLTQLSD